MTLADQLRWTIADYFIAVAILVAPRDAGRCDLVLSLAPWFGRQLERARYLRDMTSALRECSRTYQGGSRGR